MSDSQSYIITVNVGSSSIKLGLYESQTLNRIARCSAEGIGLQSGSVITSGEHESEQQAHMPTHSDALKHILDALNLRGDTYKIVGVGHRVVFTGSLDKQPTLINDEYLGKLEDLKESDPDHTPFVISVIQDMRTLYPDASHVACSDSQFFAALPATASILPLPRKYYEQGVRKHGYHGLSYMYIVNELRKNNPDHVQGKVVVAHLGSGASLAAIQNGTPVDTTMSYSPTSGIPMSSRSGDLDPSLVTYIMRQDNLSPEAFNEMVNNRAGLLGISDSSADMYTLLQEESSNTQSAEAIAVFCYNISKAIGALSAAMNGLDVLVFTGGIGSRSAHIRTMICEKLAHLDIQLDEGENDTNNGTISQQNSKPVYVMKTDESSVIAQETKRALEHA